MFQVSKSSKRTTTLNILLVKTLHVWTMILRMKTQVFEMIKVIIIAFVLELELIGCVNHLEVCGSYNCG